MSLIFDHYEFYEEDYAVNFCSCGCHASILKADNEAGYYVHCNSCESASLIMDSIDGAVELWNKVN